MGRNVLHAALLIKGCFSMLPMQGNETKCEDKVVASAMALLARWLRGFSDFSSGAENQQAMLWVWPTISLRTNKINVNYIMTAFISKCFPSK